MEQCAYIAASRVGRGGHLLTGSMDAISFSTPTRVGDIMYITAQVGCCSQQPSHTHSHTHTPWTTASTTSCECLHTETLVDAWHAIFDVLPNSTMLFSRLNGRMASMVH